MILDFYSINFWDFKIIFYFGIENLEFQKYILKKKILK